MRKINRPDWYLEGVKKIERDQWTIGAIEQVYTLRNDYNEPAVKVADIFGVEVNQVYNMTRLARRAHRKECFICGRKLSKKDMEISKKKFIKACTNCKEKAQEYKKERREAALEKGLCSYCEKEKVIPGKTSCKKCISATYRRRYKKGLCGRCGKSSIDENSNTLCHTCIKKSKKRAQTYRKNKAKTK